MNYQGIPKSLPVAGGGFLIGGSIFHQLIFMLGLFLAVYVGVLLVRHYFRPGKKLNDK